MGVLQALVGLLGSKGLLSLGFPHEVVVAVSGVVIHKYGGCPEYHVSYSPSDLGMNHGWAENSGKLRSWPLVWYMRAS